MTSAKKKGDDGEAFGMELLSGLGYKCELHPKTNKVIWVGGKPISVSSRNDYYSCADIKAEGMHRVIYMQVKFIETENARSVEEIIRKAKIKYRDFFPFYRELPRYMDACIMWCHKVWVHRHKELELLGILMLHPENINPKRKRSNPMGEWSRATLDDLRDEPRQEIQAEVLRSTTPTLTHGASLGEGG